MEWLSQNWIWLAVVAVGLYFMTRMHGMGGMGHATGRGCGSEGDGSPTDRGASSRTVFDPVSRKMIAAGGPTISTVYHDRAYYFENREDRDAFEADPEKYVAAAPGAGQAIGSQDAYRDRPRRRGGC